MKKTVLITGASSGIGEAVAKLFIENNWNVYVAARRVERMQALADLGCKVIALDVADEASRVNCIEQILTEVPQIDVLVNNAGLGVLGAVEDISYEQAEYQFKVNVLGLGRMTQLVLPGMRKAGWGRIINISSLVGRIHLPFMSWYVASKWAIEGLTDSMRIELKPFGIDAVLVEPDATRSEWADVAYKHLYDSSKGGAYAEHAQEVANGLKQAYAPDVQLTTSEDIAQLIFKAATAKTPKTRYLAGGLQSRALIALKRILPDRVFDFAVTKAFKRSS